MLLRILALTWLLFASSNARAQEAFSNGLPQRENSADQQTTTETAWIDLRQHSAASSRRQRVPDWVESVNMTSAVVRDGVLRTVFRIRVAQPASDCQIIFFRRF